MTALSPLEAADQSIDGAFSDRPIGATEQPCPLRARPPDPTPSFWIEFELVDADDERPVAHERYQLTLPDGRVLEGALDAQGVVRADGIPEGECAIYFPELDHTMTALAEPPDDEPEGGAGSPSPGGSP